MVGGYAALQGNLDPTILYAPAERIREGVKKVLEKFGKGSGHIFNLGHGIPPDTPVEHAKAFVENINSMLRRFQKIASTDIDLIFSAHGVPLRYIKHGDPYQLQIEETMRCIAERGKWNSPYTLCYQSKVGPMKWLKPSLIETVESLADKGRKHLLIIPIAFVSDHIETLYEINIDVRRHAMAHGIQQFELTPALNDHPKFIHCLAELVQAQLASDVQSNTCETLWNEKKNRTKPKMCPWMK